MPDDANPRAITGNNNPPADPFGALVAHIDDLYIEASNWADGTEIENEAQAATVDRLIDDVKDAITAAEDVQATMIKPLADQVTTIREQFYPLIGETKKVTGKAIRAKKALLAVKTKWANKLEAIRRAEAERLRQEAAKQAHAAAEAARQADDIVAAESAEDLIKQAQTTLQAAKAAEKPVTRGMRTVWRTVMADNVLAIRTMWKRYPEDFLALAQSLAERDVREGKRTIEGFVITEDRVAV